MDTEFGDDFVAVLIEACHNSQFKRAIIHLIAKCSCRATFFITCDQFSRLRDITPDDCFEALAVIRDNVGMPEDAPGLIVAKIAESNFKSCGCGFSSFVCRFVYSYGIETQTIPSDASSVSEQDLILDNVVGFPFLIRLEKRA
jgi:hypothetical protein